MIGIESRIWSELRELQSKHLAAGHGEDMAMSLAIGEHERTHGHGSAGRPCPTALDPAEGRRRRAWSSLRSHKKRIAGGRDILGAYTTEKYAEVYRVIELGNEQPTAA